MQSSSNLPPPPPPFYPSPSIPPPPPFYLPPPPLGYSPQNNNGSSRRGESRAFRIVVGMGVLLAGAGFVVFNYWLMETNKPDTDNLWGARVLPEKLSDANANSLYVNSSLRSNADIIVDSCGPIGSPYGTNFSKLDEEVKRLNTAVAEFFERESSGRSSITFKTGKVNVSQSWKQCEHSETQYSSIKLMLLDFNPGEDWVGLGYPDTGEALVLTENRLPGDNLWEKLWHTVSHLFLDYRGDIYSKEDAFLGTVAHELGHALYAWGHPFDGISWGYLDYNPVYDSLGADRAESIMSYVEYGAKWDVSPDASGNRRAYVSCDNRVSQGWPRRPGTQCMPSPPSQPNIIPSDGRLTVTWAHPSDNGGTEIIDYEVWYREVKYEDWWSSEWQEWEPQVTAQPTATTILGLENGVTYEVLILAINKHGYSRHSELVTGSPGS